MERCGTQTSPLDIDSSLTINIKVPQPKISFFDIPIFTSPTMFFFVSAIAVALVLLQHLRGSVVGVSLQ